MLGFATAVAQDSLHTDKPHDMGVIRQTIRGFDRLEDEYIEPQHYEFTVMGQVTRTYESFELSSNGQSIRLAPDGLTKVGPYFGWRWFFLGYTFDIKNIGFGHNGLKNQLDLSIYSSQVGIDIFYRRSGDDYKIRDVKLGYSNNLSRPKFAIMNPCRTFTLPPYQTAAGVTDMMMHTMERYFTKDDDMDLTTEIAEAMLRSMKNAVFAVLKNPEDYRNRAQIMWGGSLMHNGLTGCGVSDDWATHQLEHELSGMFDVTHGAGLAAIWPSWARYVMHENVSRFVRFAVNVMDVPNDFTDPEGTALKGIEAMERFYHAIGMPINIKELIGRDITDAEIKEMTRKCSRDHHATCGCLKVLEAKDMQTIYQMARG